MADPTDTDPVDQDPREAGLEERSDAPVLTPMMILGGLFLLGAVVYAISALLAR